MDPKIIPQFAEEEKQKWHYRILLGLVVLVIVLFISGFQYALKNFSPAPVVPKAENIQDFQSYPQSFPKDFVLDLQTFSSSSWVTLPDGSQSLKVTYTSPNPIDALAEAYKNTLSSRGFAVTTKNQFSGVIITATKNNEEVSYTLTPMEKNSTIVNLEYSDNSTNK